MAHENKVVRSIEDIGGRRCVDMFRRADGSFGFEEYRRDPEDQTGWSAIGGFSDARYATERDVAVAARQAVAWLSEVAE